MRCARVVRYHNVGMNAIIYFDGQWKRAIPPASYSNSTFKYNRVSWYWHDFTVDTLKL